MFCPRVASSRSWPLRKPSPRPTRSRSDPTPQAIPNMVRNERSLCAHSVDSDCLTMSRSIRIESEKEKHAPTPPGRSVGAPGNVQARGLSPAQPSDQRYAAGSLKVPRRRSCLDIGKRKKVSWVLVLKIVDERLDFEADGVRRWTASASNTTTAALLLRFFFGALVGFLQVLAAFFESAEGVVVGLDGLAVFVDGALALAGDVKNFAQLDVAPDFGPARLAVAVERGAVRIGGGLVVALEKEDFGHAVVRQRTVLVEIESFVELGERGGEVSLLLQSLPAQDGSVELDVGRVGEHVVVWVNRNAARSPEGFHGERRVGAHDFDALVFCFAVGIDAEIDGHAEKIEILINFSGHAEALVGSQAVDGVFHLEFWSARGIEPLGKEPRQLVAIIFLGDGAEVVGGGGFSGVLRCEIAHGLEIFVLAQHPAQHVQNHRALVGDQRLELGGEQIELAGA